MPQIRQPGTGLVSPDQFQRLPRAVVVIANDYPDRHVISRHSHRRAQLLYPSSGVMTVRTQYGTWVVPPLRAVWVPTGTDHEVATLGRVSMRSVNVAPRAAAKLPKQCCVVSVSALLRELIMRAATFPRLYDERGTQGRVVKLILDEISALPVLPLHLPMPAHPRLAGICNAIMREPGSRASLDDWARRINASSRTLERLFQRETGMTFTAWRQQARLHAALSRLAAGEPVKRLALELGYASPAAFTGMFRRAFGTTPKQYFAAS